MKADEGPKHIGEILRKVVDDPAAYVDLRYSGESRITDEERQRKKEYDEDKLNQWKLEVESKWNAPKRHVMFDAASKNECQQWAVVFDMLKGRLCGKGATVALVGERATGKTQLAVELMKRVRDNFKTCYFDTANGFYRAIKATYSKESRVTEDDVVYRFRKYHLLVIDEIGKTGASDWESAQLFEVLNLRYGDMRDTLLTSNQTPRDFIATIGPSLARRIDETGGLVVCNWSITNPKVELQTH